MSLRSTERRARSSGALVAVLLTGSLAGSLAGCTGTSRTASSSSGAPSSGAPSSGTGARAAAPGAPAGSPAPAGTADLQGLENAYAALVRTTLPSVVEIRTGSGLGSGVVFDDQGDIVTNAHVVGDATSCQVVLAGNQQALPATLVGSYPPDDLAVVRVRGAQDLTPATFGDSDQVQVGDIVLAMGSPLGLSSSVTNGIVSAVGRTVTEPAGEGSPGATLAGAIQTSASINPGNSGGALVDAAGQVIGLPTLAAVDPQIGQGGSAAPGIGFAINSNRVKDLAGQIISSGRVTRSHRAALGIAAVGLTDQSGQPVGVGVRSVVKGGPAAKAGISAGEAVVSVADQPTPSPSALATVLAQLQVGQTVPVAVLAEDGTRRTVQVTLEELTSG